MHLKPFHIVYITDQLQKAIHKVEQPTLVLLVKGYRYFRLLGPAGDEYFAYDGENPTLFLAAPGMRIDFATTVARENGYIEFMNDNVRLGATGHVEIGEDGHWIEVPCAFSLSAEEMLELRDSFEEVYRLWKTPVPSNLFRIKTVITAIMCRFVNRKDAGMQVEMVSPAQELRRRIDADSTFHYNLGELSRQCGYSEDHLRKLFGDRYGISPMAYRQRKRMRRSMELLLSTDLPLSEVAKKTGYRHFSHFCASFKQEYGLSPLQRRKRIHRK